MRSSNHTLNLISKPQEVSADGAATQGIKRPAGYWGMWGKCDSPYWLFTNMLDHIVKTNGKVIRRGYYMRALWFEIFSWTTLLLPEIWLRMTYGMSSFL